MRRQKRLDFWTGLTVNGEQFVSRTTTNRQHHCDKAVMRHDRVSVEYRGRNFKHIQDNTDKYREK